ncbi:MAG: hypothetical protein O9330_07015 [Beijerinckiaceae bacterium]|jgi:hypothetical protein|nr:hypothetical protein [Beijerinckiaceae bacterium]
MAASLPSTLRLLQAWLHTASARVRMVAAPAVQDRAYPLPAALVYLTASERFRFPGSGLRMIGPDA